jgi:hypothetical protein
MTRLTLALSIAALLLLTMATGFDCTGCGRGCATATTPTARGSSTISSPASTRRRRRLRPSGARTPRWR